MQKILIWLFLVIGVISLSFIIFSKVYAEVARETYKAEETDLITKFTTLYGSDENVVRSVIKCESEGNHASKGDGGNAKGVAQFWEETFYRMAKIKGEELDYKSEYDQLKLLSYAMAHDNLAREWTSYRAIKNGGKYTFYSKHYKKTMTVYCKLITK